MARQGNVMNVTIGTGAAVQLQKPVAFDDGRKCRRIRFRAPVSFTNSGAIVSATAAYLLLSFQAIFGNLTLQFGDVSPDVVDAAMPFQQLRELYAFMEGKDSTISAVGGTNTGTAIPLNLIGAAAPFLITFTATTTTVLTFETVRSFTLLRSAQDLTDWCPGTTQMKQMQLSLQPSASASPVLATVTFTSSLVQVQVIFDDMPSEGLNDVWASVARARLVATPGTTITLPLGAGGLIFAIWDESHTALTTPLTTFDVKADGRLINGTIQFSQFYQGYLDDLPNGQNVPGPNPWFDPSTSTCTPLYTAPSYLDPNLAETGEVIVFDQPNNDITAPTIVVGFIPTVTSDYVTQTGNNIQNGQQGQKSTFNLSNLHAVAPTAAPTANASAASVAPMAIVSPSDTAFSTVSGTAFSPGSLPSVSIPNATISKVSAQVTSAGGPAGAGGASTLARATKKLATAIPGYSSSNKMPQGSTSAHNTLAGKLLAGVNQLTGSTASTGAAAVAPKLSAGK
jgi:hypothetical protein